MCVLASFTMKSYLFTILKKKKSPFYWSFNSRIYINLISEIESLFPFFEKRKIYRASLPSQLTFGTRFLGKVKLM